LAALFSARLATMIGDRTPNQASGVSAPAYAGVVKPPVPVRRVFYRAAYWGLRTYWFLLKPKLSGVKCAVLDGGRVLLVRHTYGPRYWDLPGGSVKWREPPLTTARREMAEELGVTIVDWRTLGHMHVVHYHRRDTLHLFTAELAGRTIALDHGEIATAQWCDPATLPEPLGPFVEPILARLPHAGHK
jgi:8-oxo-dGTP pyrophosphatase MutT (NUDIX family)